MVKMKSCYTFLAASSGLWALANAQQSTISGSLGAVGDFVASGLGISASSTTSTLGNNSSTTLASSSSSTQTTGLSNPSVSNSIGNSSVDACWAQWNQFWSNNTVISVYTPTPTNPADLKTTTVVQPGETVQPGTYTTEIVSTSTYPLVDDDFTIGSVTTTITYVSPVLTTIPESLGMTQDAQTYTQTYTISDIYASLTTLSLPGQPSCSLPSSVSQCEASWETWASNMVIPSPTITGNCQQLIDGESPWLPCQTPQLSAQSAWEALITAAPQPQCQQASIGGDLCDSLKSAYVAGTNFELGPKNLEAMFFSQGYQGIFNGFTTVWTWPTSSSFAPSCTLGCGKCAVSGGSVKFLYWPPMTATNSSGSGPMYATVGSETLTYPTNYISYASIYASDACSGVGGTHYSTIIPIPTSDPISSLYGLPLPPSPDIDVILNPVVIGSASLNINDLLQTPVPYSIYSSQPWCATWRFEAGQQAVFGNLSCPSTRPYEPILVLPSDIYQSIDPAWSTCSADLRGLYDPPTMLSPVGNVASATNPSPNGPGATPAQSPPIAPQPDQTSAPADPNAGKPSPSAGAGSPSAGGASPTAAAPPPSGGDPGASAGGAIGSLVGGGSGAPAPSPSAGGAAPSPNAGGDPSGSDPGASVGGGIASLIGGGGKPAPSPSNANPAAPNPAPSAGNPNPNPANPNPAPSAGNPNSANPNPAPSAGNPNPNPANPNPAPSAGNPNPAGPAPVVGGQPISAAAGQPSAVVVGGATLSAGGPGATISNTPVSVGASGVVVGSGPSASVMPLPQLSAGGAGPAPVVAGQTISPVGVGLPSAVVVGGATLSNGGSAAVVGGTTVSMGSAGVVVGQGGAATTVPMAQLSAPVQGVNSVFTAAGQAYTVSSVSGGEVVQGPKGVLSTLSAGAAMTVSGVVVSAASASGGVVVGATGTDGKVTPSVTLGAGASSVAAAFAVFTGTDGKVQSVMETVVSGKTEAVVGGVTMSAGGPGTVVDGVTMSMASGGLVIGSSTEGFNTSTSATKTSSSSGSQTATTSKVAASSTTASSAASGSTTRWHWILSGLALTLWTALA